MHLKLRWSYYFENKVICSAGLMNTLLLLFCTEFCIFLGRGVFVPKYSISSVQFSHSVVSNSLRPHELQHARFPSITNSRSSIRLTSIKSVMPFSHLILCHPLLLLISVFPSIRVFPSKSALGIRWPEHWSFSFSNSPSNKQG